MAFRKIARELKSLCGKQPLNPTITKQVIVTEEHDGQVIQKAVMQELSLKDIKDSLPSADDYTLENLLAAGVDLQQVPVGHLLDSTDIAELDKIKEQMSIDLYNKLVSADVKQTAPVEPNVEQTKTND